MIVRPPLASALPPRVYDELVSGVDLLPTLLEILGVDIPTEVDGLSHARNLLAAPVENAIVRSAVYTTKTYHDSFDPIRAIRTKEYSYIENYAARPMLDLPWDIAESAPGRTMAPLVLGERPQRELYDLAEDPTESHNLLGPGATDKAEVIANDLSLLLNDWRQKTNDVIPSEFAGTRISERYTETYLQIHGAQVTSRSAIAAERGIEDEPTSTPAQ
jgi:arylsulfatase A-like enzyme